MVVTARNFFLTDLSPAAHDQITARCTAVGLPVRTPLYEPNRAPMHAFFLTSGIASIVTSMPDGASAEVSMIGRDGVVGGLHLLGPALPAGSCFMQLQGSGLRMLMTDLRHLYQSSDEIRTAILCRVQVDAMVLMQIAGCHRLHEAEGRLARWLLMARDRVDSDVLDFTQEFLADMLGARRATVTMVAGAMQRSGLIEYQRGRVRIVDRDHLEAAACGCYRIVRSLNDTHRQASRQ